MTSVNPVAEPPLGVKVTEDIVRLVVPQFQDIPTSISRFVPVPVVWEMPTLLTLLSELLETVPSRVTCAEMLTLIARIKINDSKKNFFILPSQKVRKSKKLFCPLVPHKKLNNSIYPV